MEEVREDYPRRRNQALQKSLFKITHFKPPEYRPRSLKSEETKKIPLESLVTLPDPRIKKRKIPATFQDTEKMVKKTRKPIEQPGCSTTQDAKEDQKSGEDLIPP